MFYPIESLRKGGRFNMLWVADSYPGRFAAFTNRQLWSQDIRKLCDELKVVMISECGRPTHRYSLRLSSQLMRGLVRLYQKKVNGLLHDLCMIHANVIRHTNKKYIIQQGTENARERSRAPAEPRRRTTSRPAEQRVEEILQNSTNVVANIQDITLKEATIPEVLLPPNDGFGEENPEQALQLAVDRTVEMMLVQGDAPAQRSALHLPACDLDSHDKTRLAALDMEMEMIPGHDLTMRPSVGGRQSLADFEKEIPEIPDVPFLPIPEVPAPQEKQQKQPDVEVPVAPVERLPEHRPRARETSQELEQIELEELEVLEPRPKKQRRLIIDKRIEISSDVLRARIQNPRVELRFEKVSDAIVDLQVPSDVYMSRPSRAGYKERSNLAPALTRLFMRNLGYIHRDSSTEREMEEGAMQRTLRTRLTSHLERIQEIEEPAIREPQPEVPQDITAQDNLPLEVEVSKDLANVTEPQDISDMLTQKLQTLSQQEKERESAKRVSDGVTPSPKKRRHTGYVSLKETQRKQREEPERQSAVAEVGIQPIADMGVDKENVPLNQQMPGNALARDSNGKRLATILQEAGLADVSVEPPVQTEAAPRTSRRQESEGSETPLGSLDRTKVSLGDSEKTTDSARFIRDQWGTERTMMKIMQCIHQRKDKEEITVRTLIAKGPVLPDYKNIITAKCFSSILKLKQHGFIKIIKCPDTLEIKDIMLGPELEKSHLTRLMRVGAMSETD